MRINTYGLKMRGLYDIQWITDVNICHEGDYHVILYDLETGLTQVKWYTDDGAEVFPYTREDAPYRVSIDNPNLLLVHMCIGSMTAQETADVIYEAVTKFRERELAGKVTEYKPLPT